MSKQDLMEDVIQHLRAGDEKVYDAYALERAIKLVFSQDNVLQEGSVLLCELIGRLDVIDRGLEE
ncbi:MAG: hypothetical protein ACE5DY_07435 [Mariprofundaceae bacterium]